MKLKRKHKQINYPSNNAFNQAWQNEMYRCVSQSLFGFVEFGNEFDFSINQKLQDTEEQMNK